MGGAEKQKGFTPTPAKAPRPLRTRG